MTSPCQLLFSSYMFDRHVIWHDILQNECDIWSAAPATKNDGIVAHSARVRPTTSLALQTRVLGQGSLRRDRVPERAQGSLAAEIIEKQVDSRVILPLHPQTARRFHMSPRRTRVSFDASSGRSCQLSSLTHEVHGRAWQRLMACFPS